VAHEMKIELIPIPVTDVDRAKGFYQSVLGFTLDHDVSPSNGVRVVQLTPPGSGCSILLSTGFPDVEMPPGSLRGLHLVVIGIEDVRARFVEGGVEVGEIADHEGIKFAGFRDPDGNGWVLQEIAR